MSEIKPATNGLPCLWGGDTMSHFAYLWQAFLTPTLFSSHLLSLAIANSDRWFGLPTADLHSWLLTSDAYGIFPCCKDINDIDHKHNLSIFNFQSTSPMKNLLSHRIESNLSKTKNIPPKAVIFSDFCCTFAIDNFCLS